MARSTQTVNRLALAILGPALSLSCAQFGGEPEYRGEISDFGIFEVETNGPVTDAQPVAGDDYSEQAAAKTRYKLVEQTEHIPLVRDTLFGFSWCASGYRDGLTPFKLLIELPRGKKENPEGKYFYWYWILGEVKDGRICRTETHLLSEEEDLVPGVWTISVLIKGKTVVTRRFEIGM